MTVWYGCTFGCAWFAGTLSAIVLGGGRAGEYGVSIFLEHFWPAKITHVILIGTFVIKINGARGYNGSQSSRYDNHRITHQLSFVSVAAILKTEGYFGLNKCFDPN